MRAPPTTRWCGVLRHGCPVIVAQEIECRFDRREPLVNLDMVRNPFHQHLALIVGLGVLWLALSGHYTALLMGIGVACVLFTVWIVTRMDVQDHEMHPFHLRWSALAPYAVWLAREVILSALDVARRVLSRDMPLSPTVVTLPMSQGTDMGRTIYANSITLTPGTVSIDLTGTQVQVHALTRDGAETLERGEMDARVTRLERSN